MKLFKNREEASQKLLQKLPIEKMKQEAWIVIATSAGAVPIAFEISKQLGAKFDFIFTEKIFSAKNNECEIAIITETQEIIIHEELMKAFNIQLDTIYEEAKEKYETKLQQYVKDYRNNTSIVNMENKNVLLVDEGLNTGLTMMGCIKSAISCGGKSVAVAVPVLPYVTISDIESIADDLYYVEAPAHFISIDFYYEHLEEIDIDTIKNIINKG